MRRNCDSHSIRDWDLAEATTSADATTTRQVATAITAPAPAFASGRDERFRVWLSTADTSALPRHRYCLGRRPDYRYRVCAGLGLALPRASGSVG